MALGGSRISVAIDFITTGARKGMADLKTEVANTEGALGKMKVAGSGALTMLKQNSAIVGAALTGLAVGGAKKAIDAASDLEESTNAVAVSFGDAGDAVIALGDDSAESFGLSSSAFNTAAVSYAGFTDAITGGDSSKVAGIIDGLMTRTADFASVMNIEVSDAADVFRSALAGETEPIKKYGKDLSAATVEQYALASGLIDTKAELTETMKVQARYGLLMQSTTMFAGDFANTSDGLANQQRILTAEVENLAAEFGEVLIPTVTHAVGVALDFAKALGTVKDGLESVDDATGGWLSKMAGFSPGDAWRNATGHLDKAVDGFLRIDDTVDNSTVLVDALGDVVESTGDRIEGAGRAMGDGLAPVSESLRDAAKQSTLYSKHLDDVVETTEGAAAASEKYDAMLRAQKALENYPGRLERVRERLYATSEAFGEAASTGGQAFDDLNVDSSTSADELVAHLYGTAGQIGAWKDDLVAIAANTSEGFAGYLAGMGESGADLVAELQEDPAKARTAFDTWVAMSEAMNRDVGEEFDAIPGKTDDAFGKVKEKIDSNLQDALTDAEGKAGEFHGVGLKVPSKMAAGITAGRSSAINAAIQLATSAIAAAEAALDGNSSGGGGGGAGAGGSTTRSGLTTWDLGAGFVDGFADGIEDNEEKLSDKAIEALDKAIEKARDHLDNAIDKIGDIRSSEDAREGVKDAKGDVSEAQQAVKDAQKALRGEQGDVKSVAAEHDKNLELIASAYGKNSPEYRAALKAKREAVAEAREGVKDARDNVKDAREGVGDANEGLEDAFYRLFRDLVDGRSAKFILGHADRIREVGKLAGIKPKHINALIKAASAAVSAKGDKDAATGKGKKPVSGSPTVNPAGNPVTTKNVTINVNGILPNDRTMRELKKELDKLGRETK